MTKKSIEDGILHQVPADLEKVLSADSGLGDTWNSLTPIARNEWICWVTRVKKQETRMQHIERLCEDLKKGKHRPCCWPGCPHRNPNSKKWFREKKEA